MKKLLKMMAVAMFAVCCMVLVPGAVAKADENMKIVYAQVPDDWEAPCLWAWDDDGNNAFEAWPGGEMSADEANPGWYYTYVSAEMKNVIVNANEGGVQTSDMSTGGENAWITINSPEDATVSNEQATTGEIPAYEATITVYAKVDDTWSAPCLWAWSAPDGTNAFAAWPGEAMTKNADGWYSMSVPNWVNSVIVNANEGGIQTEDITVERKNVWITVDAEGAFEIAYEKPAASAEDMITVHTKVPSDWLMPCLWAWSAPDGTNVFANWPGQEMTQDGDWYTYDIPNWVNSIIVNGNLGAVQTTDITIEPKDVWVVISSAEEYEVSYEEPTGDAAGDAEVADPATAPAEEAESGMSMTTIIIIVVVAVVVIAVVAGIIIAMKKKKQS